MKRGFNLPKSHTSLALFLVPLNLFTSRQVYAMAIGNLKQPKCLFVKYSHSPTFNKVRTHCSAISCRGIILSLCVTSRHCLHRSTRSPMTILTLNTNMN